MQHTKCYKKDYPRPQFVRNNWMNLNGTWDFAFDDEDVGMEKKYYKNFPTSQTILVPFSYQTAKSGIHDETQHFIVWYAKKQHFEKLKKNERYLLHFEGVDYKTILFVNGKYVGEHEGGYCRFSFDITSHLDKNNDVFIVLRVEDDDSCLKARGKQTWLDHPFGCWYTPTTGIWKTVWTEKVNYTHLERVKVTPIEDTYHFFFECDIANFKKGYSLRTTLSIHGHMVGQQTMLLTRNHHTFSMDATNDMEGFKIHWWSSNWPHLYDIEYELLDENQCVIDHVSSYAGFRIFKTDGSLLMLNLNPVYLKMVLEQGYFRNSGLTYENEEQMIHEIELIRQLGFNGIRVHQKIEDERFYYYCDIMGMMVFLEMPSAYEFKDATIENVSKEWMEAIKQNYNHPSIIGWVPINESWGVNRLTSNANEASFTEALYHLTKSYDKMRPVIANDGWEHTCSDIISFHNYEQNPEELEKFYQNILGVLNKENRTNYSNLRRPFVGNHSYKGQPILIDEFMGIGFENKEDKGWGYGDKVVNQEQFIRRIHDLSKVVQNIPEVNGFCITQITDVYQEINGLYDFDRQEKAPIEEMKKAIEGK